MAFKTMKNYNEERFGSFFMLRNDREFADVIFLYRSEDDVLVADTHYVKTSEYSGYVHCCGRGCPACAKGIRIQTKLFIPLYNINSGQIEFFDRNIRFENQLSHDVFSRFPNPSEYVFRIERHGVANDVNTTYSINAVGRNTVMSYDQILSRFNVSFPDHYNVVCKEFSSAKLSSMFTTPSETADMPSYSVTPRASYSNEPITSPVIPEPIVDSVVTEPTIAAPVISNVNTSGIISEYAPANITDADVLDEDDVVF